MSSHTTLYFLSTEGKIRERKGRKGRGGLVSGARRRGEEGEVNNESVPNSISDRGGVGLGDASGALVRLLVSWCQKCRREHGSQSSGSPSSSPRLLLLCHSWALRHPSAHVPPFTPRALSTGPVWPQGPLLLLSASFHNWIHFPFCSSPSS